MSCVRRICGYGAVVHKVVIWPTSLWRRITTTPREPSSTTAVEVETGLGLCKY